MIQHPFIYPLRIHIDDTDFQGIVYHSNYLIFMERARSEWFYELGLGIDWQREQKIYFSIYSVTIRYLTPAYLHEQVEVVTSIQSLRSASIIFDQHLRLASDTHKIQCKAEIKIACVDENRRPRALPQVPTLENIRRSLT